MNFFSPCLLSCLAAWFMAQTIKTVIYAVTHKKWDLRRLFGDGGMPSGHTATVTALATACGLNAGFDSAVFAVSAILTVVVCRDAVGVRRETEKQAKRLNELAEKLKDTNPDLANEPLNTFIGHTPSQIVVGAIIGIGVAVILHVFVL